MLPDPQAGYSPIIDKEFKIGLEILAVKMRSKNDSDWYEATDKETGEKYFVAKDKPDPYPEAFTPDMVVANLTEQEMRVVRLGFRAYFNLISFAKRYERSLVAPAESLLYRIYQIIVTSRGRCMAAGRLAKTQLQYGESRMIEQIGQPKPKGFFDKLMGR